MMKNKKKVSLESRGDRAFNIFVILLAVCVSIVVLYPLYYVLIASISKPLHVSNGDVMFLPKGVTFESYKAAFAKEGLLMSYGNTVYYTVVGSLTSMALTTTMGYALSKTKLVYRKFFVLFTIFTMWFHAGLIPTYLNLRDLHLMDTRTAIVLGFAMNTYNLIIMKSFFEQVPSSLEEAAFIDGANNIKIFWKVYLPLSKPVLATVGLFYAMARWNNYFWSMNLLRDETKIPLQVLLRKLIIERTANANDAAIITPESLSSPTTVIYAIVMIAIVPMLIVYPFIQKYFKTGATVGAVKG